MNYTIEFGPQGEPIIVEEEPNTGPQGEPLPVDDDDQSHK